MFHKAFNISAALMIFAAGPLASATTIAHLKTGDVLEGTDVLSGEHCKLEVIDAGLKTKTVRFTLGTTVYKDNKISKPLGNIWHYMGTYSSKQYSNTIDLQNCMANVEGSLTEGFMNDHIRYTIYNANWCEHYYQTREPFVDCQNLKLR